MNAAAIVQCELRVYLRPVHFLVMSSMARYNILNRLSSVGKIALDLVILSSCRLKHSMALVL